MPFLRLIGLAPAATLRKRIFEIDFFGDGDTVVGDRGSAPLLVENDVATLRSERDADGVSQFVHTSFEATASLLVKCNDFRHLLSLSLGCRSSDRRTIDGVLCAVHGSKLSREQQLAL
jgi:hypothetical protein